MEPDTGEIQTFESRKTMPRGWIQLPAQGDVVEMRYPIKLIAGARIRQTVKLRVAEIKNGNPGKIVLEPVEEGA